MAARRPTNFVTEGGKRASWDAIRRHVLSRAAGCASCTAPATEVDHIWPRHYGGDDRSSNLQALCTACNRAKGNRVDVDSAEAWQLDAAAQAILTRALRELDDFDVFLTPLVVGALRSSSPEAVDAMRSAKATLGVLADAASRFHDLLSEWIDEADPSAHAADEFLAAMFKGVDA